MKKILCLIILSVFCFGCANQSAYTAYSNAMIQANAYKKAPGITQEFDNQGKLVKQTINFPDDGVKVAQIKDSEWADPISQFLNLGIVGGTSWAVLREAGKITKSMKSTTYDSHNVAGESQAGGNLSGANMAGGDVSTSTPTTTTTNMTSTTTTGVK